MNRLRIYPHRWIKAHFALTLAMTLSMACMNLPMQASATPIQPTGNAYYVALTGNDSDPGTQSQPWRTIQRAVDSVSPGDSIYVLKGEYSESVKIRHSGNADKPILLTHYDQDVVTINGSGFPAILDNVGTQYWIIDGFTLTSQAQETLQQDAWGCDGTCGGTHHWIIRNNKIIGPVQIYGSNNTVEGNEVDGSSNNGNGNGVWEHYDVSHHNIYRNNFVHHFSKRGIWSMHRTHDSVFDGNTVKSIGTKTSGDCIDMDGFATVEWRHSVVNNRLSQCGASGLKLENTFDSIVKNNVIHDIARDAITVINYGPTIPTPGTKKCEAGGENDQYGDTDGNNDCEGDLTHNRIVQNLIYRSGEDGSIRVLHAGGVKILGNTVAYGTGTGIFLDKVAPQISIQNNILAKNDGWQILLWDTTLLIADEHNLFFVTDPKSAYWVDLKSYSLPGYQSLTNKGQGSITGDPQFTDPNHDNFHPQKNSPAVDAGVSIGVAADLDGNPRPQGAGYDIGVYEFPVSSIVATPAAARMNEIITYTITVAGDSKPVTVTDPLSLQFVYLTSTFTCPGMVTYDPAARRVEYVGIPLAGLTCVIQIPVRVNTTQRMAVANSATIDDGQSPLVSVSTTVILNGLALYLPLSLKSG